MHLLLLNQFFFPDSVATSQLLTDASRELARHHSVTAISSVFGSSIRDSGPEPNVQSIKIGNLNFRHSETSLIASYAAYLARACWHTLRSPRPDVILTLTTPPLLCTVGSLLKAMRGARHYIWEMDVYPDICTDLGVFKPGGLLARAAA